MSDNQEVDSAGLTFTDNVSIKWTPVDTPPDDARLAIVNESNESFLRAVAVIGASPGTPSEDDVATSQEIARLDLKVDLLLELVSQLSYKLMDIPPKRSVKVSSDEIEWNEEHPPDPGSIVLIEAFIQHGTPKPLCFYGEVITDPGNNDPQCVRVRYLSLSGATKSWLEKLIFRHHRREVAFNRAQGSINS